MASKLPGKELPMTNYCAFVSVQNPFGFNEQSLCKTENLEKIFLLQIAVTLWIKTMIFYSYISLVDKTQPSIFHLIYFRL